ncbi:MAG TPA: serine O-acetyltransferase [Phycisphaerales bacterium]|nr:serine O-acetyltransferase [Phycisphaerales bacterium]
MLDPAGQERGEEVHGDDGEGARPAVDLAACRELVERARWLVFPGFFRALPAPGTRRGRHLAELGEELRGRLEGLVRGVGRYAGDRGVTPRETADRFLARLPAVGELVGLDARAAYEGDPAASHPDEVIFCYPGLDAIFSHRVAHELYVLGVPILPRVLAEQARSRTGIDIHPGACIGQSCFIDHGSGTVIGETTVIGEQAKIYQGVTLGAKSIRKDAHGRAIRGAKRHPTIGNRVTIYAGAIILGGETHIGDDCVIAGGVFVTSSVPAGHVVMQPRPELTLRKADAEKEMWGEGI